MCLKELNAAIHDSAANGMIGAKTQDQDREIPPIRERRTRDA